MNRDRWMGRALIEIPFYWALCLSEQAFHEELGVLKVPRESWPADWVTRGKDATCNWLQHPERDKEMCMLICLRDAHKHTPIETAGLLVHEAVHVWQEIRTHMGEKEPSSEFEAYAIQRISLNLMDAYAKTLA